MIRSKLDELFEVESNLSEKMVKEELQRVGLWPPRKLWATIPYIPEALSHSVADHWRMFFVVVDILGNEEQRNLVRQMAIVLGKHRRSQTFIEATELLHDIVQICKHNKENYVLTYQLLELLPNVEHGKWAAHKHQSPIKAKSMAGMLRYFDIKPARVRYGNKGYYLSEIRDAYERLDEFKAKHEEMMQREMLVKKPPAPKLKLTKDAKRLNRLKLSLRIKKK